MAWRSRNRLALNAQHTLGKSTGDTGGSNEALTAGGGGYVGQLTSTVGRTVGLGTPRQVQFALRVNF